LRREGNESINNYSLSINRGDDDCCRRKAGGEDKYGIGLYLHAELRCFCALLAVTLIVVKGWGLVPGPRSWHDKRKYA